MNVLYKTKRIVTSSKGFTLAELTVTIAVLSILAAVVLSVLNPFAQLQKAQDGKRKSDLEQVQRTLEQYYQDYNQYPASSGSPNYRIKDKGGLDVIWGTVWVAYNTTLPKDPGTPSKHYAYVVSADLQSYQLYASLDRGAQDPQACNNGNACVNMTVSGTACGGTCNYGVTSPNTTP